MDESKIAISKSSGEKEELHFPITGNNVGDTLNEKLTDLDPPEARSTGITGPLTFIGGRGGSQFHLRGWQSGKVITRIRVFQGHLTIKAYTIWLTDSAGITYGDPAGSNFAEYTFEHGERITELTLWGNGVGTRAGWIRFVTSRGVQFSYGMSGRNPQTPYPVDVASGVLVGSIFNAGWDVDAHGFFFLNTIDNAQLTDVRYPTLSFETAGIIPMLLDRFQLTNNSSAPIDWDFTRTMSEGTETTWSVTRDVSVHASVTVQAGVPLIAEVSAEYGWQVGASSTHQTTNTSSQEFRWSVNGTAHPGDRVDIHATTRRGSINLQYQGIMVVRLRNGSTFSYPMNGMYSGVTFTAAKVIPH